LAKEKARLDNNNLAGAWSCFAHSEMFLKVENILLPFIWTVHVMIYTLDFISS